MQYFSIWLLMLVKKKHDGKIEEELKKRLFLEDNWSIKIIS